MHVWFSAHVIDDSRLSETSNRCREATDLFESGAQDCFAVATIGVTDIDGELDDNSLWSLNTSLNVLTGATSHFCVSLDSVKGIAAI